MTERLYDPAKLYDVREDELAVALRSGIERALVTTIYRVAVNGADMLALEAGVPVALPEHFALDIASRYASQVHIAAAKRAASPRWFPPQDASQARTWLHGRPRQPSRAERIEQLVKAHDLPRPSVADAAVRLIDEAGWSEADAVARVSAMHEDAVIAQRAFREPWLAEVDELIAASRAASTTVNARGVR